MLRRWMSRSLRSSVPSGSPRRRVTRSTRSRTGCATDSRRGAGRRRSYTGDATGVEINPATWPGFFCVIRVFAGRAEIFINTIYKVESFLSETLEKALGDGRFFQIGRAHV